jgi:hypothetical protein
MRLTGERARGTGPQRSPPSQAHSETPERKQPSGIKDNILFTDDPPDERPPHGYFPVTPFRGSYRK